MGEIRFADIDDLIAAYDGSYYFIAGTGGELLEWTAGYEGLMVQQEIGKPSRWLLTNGATINGFAAEKKRGMIAQSDRFKGDLACLLFPLDGLNVGRLAIFKLKMEDRWFDDVIQNMRLA